MGNICKQGPLPKGNQELIFLKGDAQRVRMQAIDIFSKVFTCSLHQGKFSSYTFQDASKRTLLLSTYLKKNFFLSLDVVYLVKRKGEWEGGGKGGGGGVEITATSSKERRGRAI